MYGQPSVPVHTVSGGYGQPGYGQPPPYGQPYGQPPPMYGQQQYPQPTVTAIGQPAKPPHYLILAILVCVCCNFICGKYQVNGHIKPKIYPTFCRQHFNIHYFDQHVRILIQTSVKFVPKDPVNISQPEWMHLRKQKHLLAYSTISTLWNHRFRQTSNISRTWRRCSRAIFHSRLNIWLQWIEQGKLQDETSNI